MKRLERFEWVLAAVGGGLCLAAILVITVVTVFGRYVLKADLIPGGYNMIGSALFPLLVFWGLPLAHREGSFPRLEVVDAMFSRNTRLVLGVFVVLAELVVYSVVAWYCARFAWVAWDTGRQLQIGVAYWPAWPIAIMAPISFALLVVESARLITRDARALLR
jgi:TRAP-type C4-dicarboxylate transport system permease small subunit